MKKRFLIAIVLLLLLSSYNIQNIFKIKSGLPIKQILIENNQVLDKQKIINELYFVYDTNIFFLRSNKIKTKLKEIDFIDSFRIKRIYPDKIKIKIFEIKPIAVIIHKKEKKYFTDNGKIVNFVAFEEFKNIPQVFGDHKNFKIFHDNLKNINYPINEIKKFYYFKSNRWDIVTKKNQTIKLPVKNYDKSLKNFIEIKDQISFKKYKIFDYRINAQLILK